MVGTSKKLFSFLAAKIQDFLAKHHAVHFLEDQEHHFKMGFTFSFPVEQKGIDEGYLLRWTKGFDIADAIGANVCELLQKELDALGCPVRVTALINDTVGTLMARSYTSGPGSSTFLGAIFGTGTNGAYLEKSTNIRKLRVDAGAVSEDMVVNTEWGAFDTNLAVLPSTIHDVKLDSLSNNVGMQLFEKRVSGMFLGELLRLTLVHLWGQKAFLQDREKESVASLFQPWTFDSSLLSIAVADSSESLNSIKNSLADGLSISVPLERDLLTIKQVSLAIGKRSARLAAVAIAAIALKEKTARPELDEIDVGVDGSLIEFFPNYQDYIQEALEEIFKRMGTSVKIRLGLARDGSGVGAALTALVAS